jgi:hypothetical protein
VDFVESVLDVLGGRIASDCAHAGVVVLLAKGIYPAKGEQNDAMKRVNLIIHIWIKARYEYQIDCSMVVTCERNVNGFVFR